MGQLRLRRDLTCCWSRWRATNYDQTLDHPGICLLTPIVSVSSPWPEQPMALTPLLLIATTPDSTPSYCLSCAHPFFM